MTCAECIAYEGLRHNTITEVQAEAYRNLCRELMLSGHCQKQPVIVIEKPKQLMVRDEFPQSLRAA